MSSITTRSARSEDHDEIVACVHGAYQGYVATIGAKPVPMLDDYAALIRHDCVTVAVEGGALIGLIVMWARADHWYVDNIAVWPEHQGRGVGTMLLAQAERVALAEGFGEIRLSTDEAMTADSTYYQRSGYTETHRSLESGYRRINYSRALA